MQTAKGWQVAQASGISNTFLHACTGQGSNGTTTNSKQDIGLMKEDKRKEIEAKWNQLISETNKPEKLKMDIKQATISAKVIRRRKGNPDLHIR